MWMGPPQFYPISCLNNLATSLALCRALTGAVQGEAGRECSRREGLDFSPVIDMDLDPAKLITLTSSVCSKNSSQFEIQRYKNAKYRCKKAHKDNPNSSFVIYELLFLHKH